MGACDLPIILPWRYTEWHGAYQVSAPVPTYGSAVERGQEEEVKFEVRKHWYLKERAPSDGYVQRSLQSVP